jgi:HAD superfamily hydrolase (TIGR01549 family)
MHWDPEAVIFDLDDTLLDTSSLALLRYRGLWGQCMARLDEAEVFEVPAGECAVVEMPKMLRKVGFKIGLLTHSPSHYAQTLLERHGIRLDAIVTGSDGFPAKPDPTGLGIVAAQMEVDPGACLYVGDSVGDFGAAAAAGMHSAGVAWGQSVPESWGHGWPDAVVDRPSLLLEYLERDRPLGPAGEALAAGIQPQIHWGSIIRLTDDTFALGRYFVTADRRAQSHALSELVLRAKSDEGVAEAVADTFVSVIRHANPTFQMVVSVPPSPEGAYDRFEVARISLAEAFDAEDGGDLLEMRYAVDDYKSLNHDTRRQQCVGRFAARRELEGAPHVLLIDDVITSGAQAKDCRRALQEAGAGRVTIIALAASQAPLPEACPVCGGTLRVKTNSYTGQRFVGCSNFNALGCDYSRSIPQDGAVY